jgi:hypothetical protein
LVKNSRLAEESFTKSNSYLIFYLSKPTAAPEGNGKMLKINKETLFSVFSRDCPTSRVFSIQIESVHTFCMWADVLKMIWYFKRRNKMVKYKDFTVVVTLQLKCLHLVDLVGTVYLHPRSLITTSES